MPRLLPTLLLILLIRIQSNSQKPPFFIDHYSQKDGLSFDVCNDIVKDRYGFIWIATENGLNRFDGKNFKIYYHNPHDSLSPVGNTGYSLYEDKRGYIWYCNHSRGMNRYNPLTDKFRQYPNPAPGVKDPSQVSANALCETNAGKLWMANERGLCYYDTTDEKIKYVYFKGQKQVINPSSIKAILEDSKKNLWIATFKGVYRVDFLQNKLVHLDADAYTNWLACDIKEDWNGNIWIGYWGGGLKRYNPKTRELKTFWADSVNKIRNSKNIFTNICFQRINNRDVVWASSAGSLLYELDMNTEKLIQHNMQAYFPDYSQAIGVRKVYTDNSNNLWLATTYGVIKIDPLKQLFHSVEIPASHRVKWYTGITAVYADPFDKTGNTLWLIVTDEGLIKYNIATGELERQEVLKELTRTPRMVEQISRSASDDLWIAAEKGLIQYNDKANTYKLFPFNYPIRCFWFDGNRKFWLGTSNGIYTYDIIENRFVKIREPSVAVALSQSINDLCVDKNGNLWFARGYSAGKSAGLSMIDPKNNRETVYYQHPQLSPEFPFNDEAFSIFCDSRNQIWIGTFNGLVVFDPAEKEKQYELIAPFNGFPNNKVWHILQQDSLIWVNGHNGVSVININCHCILTTYTEEQGLVSNSIEVIEQGNNGKLFFADNLTLQYLNIDRIPVKPAPQVYITDIKVLNKQNATADTAALFLKHLDLNYRQNAIEFVFTSPDFVNPEEIQYAYKLKGVDKDWKYSSFPHASYSNLDGGNYLFTVKAGNNSGFSKYITAFSFHVDAPWWKTWWFYLLCAITVLAVFYSIYYVRVSRLKELLKLRNKIAGDLHDDIGSTLSSIHIMSEVAKQKAPQSSVLLEKIGSDAQQMQESMSDIVWAINPKNDRFENVLQRMKIFASEMLEAEGIELVFSADEALHHLKLTMNQRRNIYFIFKEAITNLAKHAGCKNVLAKISLHNKTIELLVQDDGNGFDNDHQTLGGNGLYTMQKRANDLHGLLKIDSSKGKGTTVHLQFKIT